MFFVMCGSFICGLGLEFFMIKRIKKQKKLISLLMFLGGVCLIALATWLAWPK